MTSSSEIGPPDPEPATIEIRIAQLDLLFHAFDPRPQASRRLSEPIDEFIVETAEREPRKRQLRLYFQVQAPITTVIENDVRRAVQAQFAWRERQSERELRKLFKCGSRALATGLVLLAICLRIGPAAGELLSDESWSRFVEEGFYIIGWAANWRPVEVFLYDWWPVFQQKALYRRLAEADIRVEAVAAAPSEP